MVVVQAVHFRKDGVAAGHEMAFHDLRDFLQVGDHFRIAGGFRQGDADVGAHVETEGLRLHEQAGTGDDAVGFQALDALMDGRAGDAAFTGDFQERHPRVLDEEGQNFLVDLVDVIRSHKTYRDYCLKLTTTKVKIFFKSCSF